VPPATGSRIDKAGEEKKTSGKVSEGMYHILFDVHAVRVIDASSSRQSLVARKRVGLHGQRNEFDG
jgi:hypothetical protein